MKSLKGLGWPERQRRHHAIMEMFELHADEGLPWMATISQNDPDVILEITSQIREPVGVYSWYNKGNWFSISVNQISQSIDGNFEFLEFGKQQIESVRKVTNGIEIGSYLFVCPEELVDIYYDLLLGLEDIATNDGESGLR